MAKLPQTIFHVQKGIDLAAVVDKILRIDARKIFLVVTDEARIAQYILNFQLLKREAETARKEVIILSSNARIGGLASKAGLQVHQLSDDFVYWNDGGGEDPKKEEPVFVHLSPKKVSDILAPSS